MNSTVFEMIIRVFGAFLSIYSFAVLLQVPRRFVLQAGIVGAIGGFVYLLAIHFGRGDVMASLYSAVAAAVVSHIFARVYKMSEFYLIQTLEIAGVISLAIFVVDTFFQAFQKSEWKQNSMKYVRKIVPGAEEPQNTEKRGK